MKQIISIIFILLAFTSCAYNDDNDSAQKEADIIFLESEQRCNRIKGRYEGELFTDNRTIQVIAGIYCQPSAQSTVDKDGVVITRIDPYINLQRQDIPIPVTLQVQYTENTGSIIMVKPGTLQSGGGTSPNNGGQNNNQNTGAPPPSSLAASINYDPISSFNGKISSDTYVTGNAFVATAGGLVSPIGELHLKKTSSENVSYSAVAIANQTEAALLKIVAKYTGMYHGCLQEASMPKSPYNISVELTVRDLNIGGKSVKALRTVYKRYDIQDEKTRTKEMSVVIDLLEEAEVAISMNSYATPGSVWTPDLSGVLKNLPPMDVIDESDVFQGTYSSQLGGSLGVFKLIKARGRIQDCRKMFN